MGNKPPIPNPPRTTRTKLKSALRSKRLIGLLAACAAAVVLPITAFGTSSAHAAIQPPAAAPSQAQWRNLSTLASSHSATLGVADDSSPVLSLPAGTSAAQEARLEAGIPAGMKVTVKTSQFAPGETDTIEKAVMSRKWLSNPKQYSVGVSYDSATDKVIVDTDAPASETASLLRSYPAGKLEVSHGRFDFQANRFSDVDPFWGGDFITNGSQACTSGFWIVDGNSSYMSTAGHCFPLDSSVYNLSQSTSTRGNYMGYVDIRDQSLDIELFNGKDYEPDIWTGGDASSTSSAHITGYNGPYVGLQICVSGAVTYNHCGHPISNVDYHWIGASSNIAAGNGFVYDRGGTNAPDYNNGKVTTNGDSGAPIYVPTSGGNGVAYGSHVGSFTDSSGVKHMFGVSISAVIKALGSGAKLGS